MLSLDELQFDNISFIKKSWSTSYREIRCNGVRNQVTSPWLEVSNGLEKYQDNSWYLYCIIDLKDKQQRTFYDMVKRCEEKVRRFAFEQTDLNQDLPWHSVLREERGIIKIRIKLKVEKWGPNSGTHYVCNWRKGSGVTKKWTVGDGTMIQEPGTKVKITMVWPDAYWELKEGENGGWVIISKGRFL